jgi:hypothetical protein
MANRKKPTHPSSITRENVTAALANVDPVRVKKLPPPKPGRTILEAGADIVEALERVMSRRVSYVQQRLTPPRPKRTPAGDETRERAARAPEGIESEPLSKNDGHQRARVRFPMALTEEKVHRDVAKLTSAKGRKEVAEPPLKGSRFDKALDHEDGPILRAVLSRYIEDHAIAFGKPGGGEETGRVNCASQPHQKLPLTEPQQKALARIAFIEKHLGSKDRTDLRQFKQMMIPLVANQEPMSMSEYGELRTGLKDDRVREGVFIGIMLKVAERMHDIYRLKELPAHLAEQLLEKS